MNTPNSDGKKVNRILWGILVLLVLLTVVLIATCRPPKKGEDTIEAALPVQAQLVEPRTIDERLRVPGRLEPFVQAVLSAEQDGLIVELNGDKGDAVTNGQLLLRIDGRTWEQARRRAEVEIRDAEKDVARWQELRAAGAVSVTEYEAIQTRKERAEIALAEADVFLSQCEVRSPLDGWVNDRQVDLGEYIGKGQPVFEVVDVSRLKLVFDVPEKDAAAVAPGAEVSVELAALPGGHFTGRVTFVSFLARRENNAFRVEALMENAGGRLKPGMIVGVELVRRHRPGSIVVPLAAIMPRKGEHVVYTVEDGRAVRSVVQIDAIIGSEAVLGAGLQAGAELVVDGHRALQDGMRVDVTRAPAGN